MGSTLLQAMPFDASLSIDKLDNYTTKYKKKIKIAVRISSRKGRSYISMTKVWLMYDEIMA